MAQINIRMDEDLKASAEVLFNELGMSMSTAVNVFVRQAVRQGGMPFEVTTKPDHFYSATNMQRLRDAIADVEAGKSILIERELIEASDD
jgi:DNA-damage-inducible protein J